MLRITTGAMAVLCLFASPVLAQTFYSAQISTGGVTGTYYVIASPLAKYVAEHSDIKLTPSTSGGGPENLRRVNSGQAKFGMTQPDTMFEAWNGMPPFDKPQRDWRTIGIVTPIMLNHVIVRADSGIKTSADLAGKTFAIGAPGSGSAVGMMRFLDSTGEKDKVNARMLPHQDYPDMLQDGKIDAFSRLGSIPTSVIEELSAQIPINLVDFGQALKASNFTAKYPYYEEVTIPAGTYKGIDHPVTMFGNAGYIIVNKDVPDDVVYEFTKLAYSPEAVQRVTMAFKGVNLDAKNPLAGNIGPLHPGARKFWEEQGIKIPDPVLK